MNKKINKKPPNAGKGRKKGVPNKLTQSVKDALEQSLNDGEGGVAFFNRLKEQDPKTYAGVVAKLIPHQINQEINSNNTHQVHIEFKETERRGDS